MRKLLFICLLLFGCATPLVISPTLIQDANLAVAALNTLSGDMTLLGAPAADATAISLVTGAIQTALTDLESGAKTPADFVQLVNDQVSTMAPTLLKDFATNNKITTGVILLQQLLPLMAAEVTAQPTVAARLGDARKDLQDWVNSK